MHKSSLHLAVVTMLAGLIVPWMFAAGPSAGVSSQPTTRLVNVRPITRPADLGPDLIIMKELVEQHEPVPFDHKSHAVMAEMWNGCVTCHHRNPTATTQPTVRSNGNGGGKVRNLNAARTLGEAIAHLPNGNGRHASQEDAAAIPACKYCHPASADDPTIEMPNLKGAYHRQCLNCHKEWTGQNACAACHERRGARPATVVAHVPTKDDIVGRLHPPIPEPLVVNYKTRFTPAVGEHVVFRHTEHTGVYGLRCVSCHHRDICASCHDPKTGAKHPTPMKPGRTWKESHTPCVNCHAGDRCNHCHYKDGQPIPPSFDHAETVQVLDKDHVGLHCFKCHTTLKSRVHVTCGDALCHPKDPTISFPLNRPGPINPNPTTRPVTASGPQRGVMR